MNGADFWKTFLVPLLLLVLFVVAFLGVNQISKKVTKTPTVEITSGNEIVTDQPEVPISGVVHNTTKLKIANKDVAVAKDGSFSTTVPVEVGTNNVEIIAGSNDVATSVVKVTREEPQKAVAATTTANNNGSDLSTSGPAETAMGSFGLAAISISLMVYWRSKRQNTLQKA